MYEITLGLVLSNSQFLCSLFTAIVLTSLRLTLLLAAPEALAQAILLIAKFKSYIIIHV